MDPGNLPPDTNWVCDTAEGMPDTAEGTVNQRNDL
jgi:hypothetical protein